MAKTDVRELALNLAVKHGRRALRRQLVIEGVSPATADCLARGRYPNQPQGLVSAAVLRAAKALEVEAA